MHIANLKIGTRLGLAFAVILALMLGLTGVGVNSMRNIQGHLDGIVQDNGRKMELLQDIPDTSHVVSETPRPLALVTHPPPLALEKQINPYLRTHLPSLRRAAEQHCGRSLPDTAQVFAVLRRWKDGFKAP